MSKTGIEHHISKECVLFSDCPFNWDCLLEIALYGSAIWSLELCYDLTNLIMCGFVDVGGYKGIIERRICLGMIGTFYGSILQLEERAEKE